MFGSKLKKETTTKIPNQIFWLELSSACKFKAKDSTELANASVIEPVLKLCSVSFAVLQQDNSDAPTQSSFGNPTEPAGENLSLERIVSLF